MSPLSCPDSWIWAGLCCMCSVMLELRAPHSRSSIASFISAPEQQQAQCRCFSRHHTRCGCKCYLHVPTAQPNQAQKDVQLASSRRPTAAGSC